MDVFSCDSVYKHAVVCGTIVSMTFLCPQISIEPCSFEADQVFEFIHDAKLKILTSNVWIVQMHIFYLPFKIKLCDVPYSLAGEKWIKNQEKIDFSLCSHLQ